MTTSDPGTRLFPRQETRLAAVMGAAAAVPAMAAAVTTALTASALAGGPQSVAGVNLWFTIAAVVLPAVIWAASATGAFALSAGKRSVFGFLVGVLAVEWCYSGVRLLVALESAAGNGAFSNAVLAAPLVNDLVGVLAVLAVALLYRSRRRRPEADDASEDAEATTPRRAGGAFWAALGLDLAHQGPARALALWAIGLAAVGSVWTLALSELGVHDTLGNLAVTVVLVVSVYAAVRWRGAPRGSWLPGSVSSLAVLAFYAVLAQSGGLAAAADQAGVSATWVALALALLRAALLLVAAVLAARSLAVTRRVHGADGEAAGE